MAAPLRTPRSSWIEQGLRSLGVGGPDAVRIEKLAQALGVSKGGFYWHFQDREALLGEMLDAWERVMIDEVIERVEAGGGDGSRGSPGPATNWSKSTSRSGTGRAGTRPSPGACAGSTTAGWTTCGRCSATSAGTTTRSRSAACCSWPCGSATT